MNETTADEVGRAIQERMILTRRQATSVLVDLLPDGPHLLRTGGRGEPVVMLALDGLALFVVTFSPIKNGDAQVSVQRQLLDPQGCTIDVEEQHSDDEVPTRLRRWTFQLGATRPLLIEGSRGGDNSADDDERFAQALAGALGWGVSEREPSA